MKTYTASCHCGVVKISFETEPITDALECNCSHCERKGLLLIFMPTEKIKVLSGEGHQTEYRFNKQTIGHLFCKTCGVQVYSKAQFDGKEMSSVNVRTVDDIDLEDITRKKVNGKEY